MLRSIILQEIEKITEEANSPYYIQIMEELQQSFINDLVDEYNLEESIISDRQTTASDRASEKELETKKRLFSQEFDNSSKYICAVCKLGCVERYMTKKDR